MKAHVRVWWYIAEFFVEWEMFQTNVAEKIKTRFLCSIPFFHENRAFYEIIWKNIVQPDRPQMTIWFMPIACSVNKATDTHSEYVIHTVVPRQRWLRQRASMWRYTYIACLVNTKLCSLNCFSSNWISSNRHVS